MKKLLRKGLAILAAMLVAISGISMQPMNADAATYFDPNDALIEDLLTHFGLIAFGELDIDTHCHSNFLVKTLDQKANSGLRSSFKYDEIFYFDEAVNISHNVGEDKNNMADYEYDVIITKSVVSESGGKKTVKLTNGNYEFIDFPKNVVQITDYADMGEIQNKFGTYNTATLVGLTPSSSTEVVKDFSDNNKQMVKVVGSDAVYSIEMAPTDFTSNLVYFKFDNVNSDVVLVVNIDMAGQTNANFRGLILLDNSNNPIDSSENNFGKNYNKVFFNFYDSTKADKKFSGNINFEERGFGTVIAPYASINFKSNWDGTAVAKDIIIGGQYHRINATQIPPSDDAPQTPVAATGSFSKISTVTSEEIPGAKLMLKGPEGVLLKDVVCANNSTFSYDENNNTVSWTSNTVPTELSKLPAGKYTLKEEIAPSGYELSEETISFVVSGFDGKIYTNETLTQLVEGQKIVMKNAPQAVFSKTSVASTNELPGATLELTSSVDISGVTCVNGMSITPDSTDKKKISWVSGDKPVILSTLPAGEYTLTEITAPGGYAVAESISFVVKQDGMLYANDLENEPIKIGDTVNKIVMYDAPQAVFSKISAASTDELPGATLVLTSSVDISNVKCINGMSIAPDSTDNKKISWVSGDKPVMLSTLPAGSYTLTEITAPTGYAVKESITFVVKADGMLYENDSAQNPIKTDNVVNKIVMKDAPITGEFSKSSTVSSGEIPDATLMLSAKNDLGVDINLNNVICTSGHDVSNTNGVLTWISTDTSVKLSMLPVGQYTLTEITAPNGYAKTEAVTFEVRPDGKFYANSAATDPINDDNKITMYDAPQAVFSKTSVASTDELPGATLVLISSVDISGVTCTNGMTITPDTTDKTKISWVSGDKPVILSTLPAGSYTLTEITSPAGYAVAESITFVVKANGMLYENASVTTPIKTDDTVNKIVMRDEPIEGEISNISTVSNAELAETEVTLTVNTPGVNLESVKKSEGPDFTISADKKTISWTTSGSKTLSLTGLPIGSYTLKEVTPTNGYTAQIGEITFVIKDNGKFYATSTSTDPIPGNKLQLKNTPNASGKISKVEIVSNGASMDLVGAELTLVADFDLSGVCKISGPDFTLATDKKSISWTSGDAPLELSGLPVGLYTLKETKAPDGYLLADDISFNVDSDGNFYIVGGSQVDSNYIKLVDLVDPNAGGNPDGGSGNPDGGSGNPDGGSGNPDGGSGNPGGGTGTPNGGTGTPNGGTGTPNGGTSNGGSNSGLTNTSAGGTSNGGSSDTGTGIGGAQTTPKTGDDFAPALWIALIAVCLGAIGFIVVKGRKLVRREDRTDR